MGPVQHSARQIIDQGCLCMYSTIIYSVHTIGAGDEMKDFSLAWWGCLLRTNLMARDQLRTGLTAPPWKNCIKCPESSSFYFSLASAHSDVSSAAEQAGREWGPTQKTPTSAGPPWLWDITASSSVSGWAPGKGGNCVELR